MSSQFSTRTSGTKSAPAADSTPSRTLGAFGVFRSFRTKRNTGQVTERIEKRVGGWAVVAGRGGIATSDNAASDVVGLVVKEL